MYLENTKVLKTRYIYESIEECLNNGGTFGICRFGNAEIDTIREGRLTDIRSISQGIPKNHINELMEIFKRSANTCDFVASMSVYYSPDYFNMHISRHQYYNESEQILKKLGITNNRYCNPDVGYLLFLEGKYNLLNLIRNRRICLITSKTEVYKVFERANISVGVIPVTPQTLRKEWHEHHPEEPLCGRWHWYEYENIKEQIKNNINNYDIFLIGAGYLAKGYSAYIKDLGGISVDVGKVMNTWSGEGFYRLNDYLKFSDTLSFTLTENGISYKDRL
jgi:hypothetical protein